MFKGFTFSQLEICRNFSKKSKQSDFFVCFIFCLKISPLRQSHWIVNLFAVKNYEQFVKVYTANNITMGTKHHTSKIMKYIWTTGPDPVLNPFLWGIVECLLWAYHQIIGIPLTYQSTINYNCGEF